MSSLPEGESFYQFLEVSLSTMRRECEPAYRLLCELLAPRQVQITVDGEAVTLDFDASQVTVLPVAAARPVVSMVMGRETILDLADAKFTLQGAILDGVITIHGDLKDLVLFHEGWLTFMRGAIRCPSFPDLLERYRFNPTITFTQPTQGYNSSQSVQNPRVR